MRGNDADDDEWVQSIHTAEAQKRLHDANAEVDDRDRRSQLARHSEKQPVKVHPVQAQMTRAVNWLAAWKRMATATEGRFVREARDLHQRLMEQVELIAHAKMRDSTLVISDAEVAAMVDTIVNKIKRRH